MRRRLRALLTASLRASLSPQGAAFIADEVVARRWRFAGFLALSFAAAVIEFVGVGLVYPLLIVIVDPDSAARFAPLGWLMRATGIAEGAGLFILLTSLIAAVMVLKNVYMVYFNWLKTRMFINWKVALSRRLMQSYLFSDYVLFLKRDTGDFIRNLSLLNAVYDQYLTGVVALAVNGMMLVGLGLLLLIALPSMTVVALVLVCGLVGVFHVTVKGSFERTGREINEIYDVRQRVLRQSIGMIKEIKIIAKEAFFLDRFTDVEGRNFRRSAHYGFMFTVPPLVIEAAIIVAVLALVTYILFQSDGRSTGLATLGLLAATLFRAMMPLNRTLSGLQIMSLSRNSVDILGKEIASLGPAPTVRPEPDVAVPFTTEIAVEDASFQYPDVATPALENVSVTIGRGEFVGITGPSGAGKTTLVALLMGLLSPSSGSVRVDGADLEDPDRRRAWQTHIGYVAQAPFVIEDTVAANVAFGERPEDVDEARVWQVLDMVSLRALVEGFPGGIHHFLGDDGKRLSGGERQRFGIARALYRDPAVLVLDEPTSALDAATEQHVARSLRELRGSRTIIMIAHRLRSIHDCDRVVMMSRGRVLDAAPFEVLAARCEEFRKLVELSALRAPAA